MNRSGKNRSFWECRANYSFGAVQDKIYDVIIVGAGITGITLAHELQKKRKRCLLIDKEHPGFGTTGRTTAFINNFFDTSYDEIIANFGENNAKALADATKKVILNIKQNMKNFRIKCEFAECNFYLFSSEKIQNEKLCKILKAHQTLGIKTNRTYDFPFDIPRRKVLEISGQAQLHPLKYIKALLKKYILNDGILLTGTLIKKNNSQGDLVVVETEDGKKIVGKNLIWATHNAPGNSRFNLLIAPCRSYALAAKMFVEPKRLAQCADLEEPYHYIRYHQSGDEFFLIAGGFDHKTGHESNAQEQFEKLEEYVQERFENIEILQRWSAQYYVPADGLPYIGKMPGEKNIYISTGYNGNGMTFGPMASLIIPQLMDGEETELSRLLSPSRINLKSVPNLVRENVDAIFQFLNDKLISPETNTCNFQKKDEGKILQKNGKTVAVYKDEKGKIHYLNPSCTHMGCNVRWNNTEKSWDCPCHGSRFDGFGNMLLGPALENLEKWDVAEFINTNSR